MANFAAHQPSYGRAKNLGRMARCFASTEILRLRAQNDTRDGSSEWPRLCSK
jgi:hypothetical protein